MPIVFETDAYTDTFIQCTSTLLAFNNNSVCHPSLPSMVKPVFIILFASLVAHYEKRKKWQQQQSSSTVWKRIFASIQNNITARNKLVEKYCGFLFSLLSIQNRSYDRNGYKRWTCSFSSWRMEYLSIAFVCFVLFIL